MFMRSLTLNKGDLVVYEDSVYKVVSVGIADVRIEDNAKRFTVALDEIIPLGQDNISILSLDTIPDSLPINSFVRHVPTGLIGKVTDVINLKVRCTVQDKIYNWHIKYLNILTLDEINELCTCGDNPHHPMCVLYASKSDEYNRSASHYFPSANKQSRPTERRRINSWDDTDFDPKIFPSRRFETKAEEPVIKRDCISTADFINEEIKELRKKESDGDIPPAEPDKPSPSSVITKRKGSW